MNGIGDEQIELLAEGISMGLSRANLAKYAGVSESTAVRWRNYGIKWVCCFGRAE